jgi:23S rRNA pseudouridine1911/1915/1917 synthase
MYQERESLAASSADDEAEAGPSGTEQRAWQVGLADAGERLDKRLVAWLPEFSRSHAQWLLAEGAVHVDGVAMGRRDASRRLRLGQRVEAELRLPQSAGAYLPQPIDLVVLHEDADLLVIHKPAGLVVHPGAGNWQGTLLNGLLHRYAPERCGPGITPAVDLPRAGIVHRLDKDTSGLMLVARSAAAVTSLVAAISAREVARQYLALVGGRLAVPDAASGEWRTVDAPIGRDPTNRVRMAVLPPGHSGGKPARTRLQRLGLGADADGHPYSLLCCQLETGRTHQIRVHLAHLGHPITGDAVYGRVSPLIGRQALHAHRLALAHPTQGIDLRFEAPVPADFEAALAAAGLAQAFHYNEA